jgi:hypothetical protein
MHNYALESHGSGKGKSGAYTDRLYSIDDLNENILETQMQD